MCDLTAAKPYNGSVHGYQELFGKFNKKALKQKKNDEKDAPIKVSQDYQCMTYYQVWMEALPTLFELTYWKNCTIPLSYIIPR